MSHPGNDEYWENKLEAMMEKPRWLESCKSCGKKHLWEIGLCDECGIYEVPRLVSEKACYVDQTCEGCVAYRDHLR